MQKIEPSFGLAPIKQEGKATPLDKDYPITTTGEPSQSWLEITYTAADFRALAKVLYAAVDSCQLASDLADACMDAAKHAEYQDKNKRASK